MLAREMAALITTYYNIPSLPPPSLRYVLCRRWELWTLDLIRIITVL